MEKSKAIINIPAIVKFSLAYICEVNVNISNKKQKAKEKERKRRKGNVENVYTNWSSYRTLQAE